MLLCFCFLNDEKIIIVYCFVIFVVKTALINCLALFVNIDYAMRFAIHYAPVNYSSLYQYSYYNSYGLLLLFVVCIDLIMTSRFKQLNYSTSSPYILYDY